MAQPQQAIPLQGTTGAVDRLQVLRDHTVPKGVPPGIHEDIIANQVGYEDDSFVRLARDARKAGREAAERQLELAKAVLADPSETMAARHVAVHKQTHAIATPVLAKIQTAVDKIDARCEALEELLRGPKPPTTPAGMMAMIEARSALSRLPPAQRRQAIMHSLDKKDALTALAVTRVSNYVLGPGVDDAELALYQQTWANKNHALEIEQLKVLRTELDHTASAGRLLLGFTASLSSSAIVEEARALRERRVKAEA